MTNGSLMPAAAPLYKEAALGLAPRDVGEKPEPLRFDPSASPAEATPEEGVETTVLVPGGGVFRKMSEVKPEAVEWVADGWIPNREITVLGGDGGVGKGLFTAQLAAYLTTGRTSELFPTARADTGNVLLLSGEDSIRSVLWQRLTAAGAALDKVQAAVMKRVGCGGSTYDHVRCGMRAIRSEKSGRRGKNYTVLNRDEPGADADPVCSADAS